MLPPLFPTLAFFPCSNISVSGFNWDSRVYIPFVRAMMSESQIPLPKHREYSSKRPEQKVLRQTASTLLLLDFSTLLTLQNHGKPIDCQTFRQLTEKNLANINHDGHWKAIPLELRVKKHVRTLSGTDLDRIVKRPINSRYYCEMIYLRIAAFNTANDNKEEEINNALYDENP